MLTLTTKQREVIVGAILMRARWYATELGELKHEGEYPRATLEAMTDEYLVETADRMGLDASAVL